MKQAVKYPSKVFGLATSRRLKIIQSNWLRTVMSKYSLQILIHSRIGSYK